MTTPALAREIEKAQERCFDAMDELELAVRRYHGNRDFDLQVRLDELEEAVEEAQIAKKLYDDLVASDETKGVCDWALR